MSIKPNDRAYPMPPKKREKRADSPSAVRRRHLVQSSMLLSVGYDPADKVLEIEFKNGQVYRYFDVQPELFAELMNAESIGQFFVSKIKNDPNRQWDRA